MAQMTTHFKIVIKINYECKVYTYTITEKAFKGRNKELFYLVRFNEGGVVATLTDEQLIEILRDNSKVQTLPDWQ